MGKLVPHLPSSVFNLPLPGMTQWSGNTLCPFTFTIEHVTVSEMNNFHTNLNIINGITLANIVATHVFEIYFVIVESKQL